MFTKYEEIIELVKELGVITNNDLQKFFKVGRQTAKRILLRMENKGILKYRVIMRRGNYDYKVWVLRKY